MAVSEQEIVNKILNIIEMSEKLGMIEERMKTLSKEVQLCRDVKHENTNHIGKNNDDIADLKAAVQVMTKELMELKVHMEKFEAYCG